MGVRAGPLPVDHSHPGRRLLGLLDDLTVLVWHYIRPGAPPAEVARYELPSLLQRHALGGTAAPDDTARRLRHSVLVFAGEQMPFLSSADDGDRYHAVALPRTC